MLSPKAEVKSLDITLANQLLDESYNLCNNLKQMMWFAASNQQQEQYMRIEIIYARSFARYTRRWQIYQHLMQNK